MIDFRDDIIRQKISSGIIEDINKKASERRKNRYSTRLSPSWLGEECAAASMFRFRWAQAPTPSDGRMSRYNERGEKNENDFTHWLRETGWTVREIDEKTQQQIAVSAFSGHLYGKCDGIASHPEYTQNIELLLEYKYINYKRFSALTNKPLITVDPKYYAQINIYMNLLSLPATIFIPANRNDEDFKPIIIPYDAPQIELLWNKANTLLTTKVLPAKIATSPAFHKCTICDFKDECHNGKPVAKNCRSCIHSTPIENGKWRCDKWNAVIPNKDAMIAGCPNWESLF